MVYGRPAIALPIPLAVEAAVRKEPKSSGDGINVVIPRWGLEQKVTATTPGVAGIMANLIEKMGLEQEHMTIEVFPHVPRAMGLGGSSALAVAIVRALSRTYELALPETQINALALSANKRLMVKLQVQTTRSQPTAHRCTTSVSKRIQSLKPVTSASHWNL